MNDNYLLTAAKLLGGNDTGLLHYGLCDYLDEIANMVRRAGGLLVSRQAIAVAIQNFRNLNPNAKLYGD